MTALRTLSSPTRTLRRGVVLVVGGLVAAFLPLAATAPAQAAPESCPVETNPVTGCDDTQPPNTAVTAVSPAPNADGFIRSSSVTFAFSGTHAGEDDTGTIGFECQLFTTDPATPPATWEPCTSPRTYTALEDLTTSPYTFRVRAVDTTDEGVDALLVGTEHDWDASPAVSTLKVDTAAPNTFVTKEPVDSIRPDWPVVLSEQVTIGLNSNETPTTFACTVNGDATPCATGEVKLRNLAPGNATFVARAVDRAFNLDPTPATTRFFVPADIRKSKGSGWTNVRKINRGYFDNDYVEARRVGQTLAIRGVKKVREVRLIALVGPKAGSVEVRVGRSQWYRVDLFAKKARTAQLLVRDEFSPLQRGTIRVRVASLRGTKSSVRLDAVVARP